MDKKFDFGGYATKNDLKCADGRTIRKNAFVDCDGATVPLVWGHKHGSPENVLGHAILENREDGVYTYGSFNDTDAGRSAKELVRHGDVKALSIYANQLVQKGGDVIHGMIREVSLCLAGANPGARIEELSFEHSIDEDCEDFDAVLFNGDNIVIEHAEEPKEEPEEKKEENPVANEKEKTVQDVFNELTEEQKNVVYYMIGQALEQNGADAEANEEEEEVAHNLFEGDNNENTLTHAERLEAMNTILKDAKKYGTLKDSYEYHMNEGVLAHDIDTTGMDVPEGSYADYATQVGYGVRGVDFLFPDAKTLNDVPDFIQREMNWVKTVLNGVHRSPFSRIKTVFANITEDEARAKGYLKGNLKKNEFFTLMKRTTIPQTVYKKQKMDRDDVVDITDFNVVAWIKSEMRMMLDEELARAILIGDGRLIAEDDKISEEHIRPIASDADLFTIKATVAAGSDESATAKNMIKTAVRARKNYKGSGNPTLYTTEEWLNEMLLIEDGIGHPMYKTESELATALRVRNIVTVPVMEGYTNAGGQELMGIIVNMNDYNVGADKGGEINMFDDFNIDYNQYVYLIETRCSGTLVKPYSAIALFKAGGSTTTT